MNPQCQRVLPWLALAAVCSVVTFRLFSSNLGHPLECCPLVVLLRAVQSSFARQLRWRGRSALKGDDRLKAV